MHCLAFFLFLALDAPHFHAGVDLYKSGKYAEAVRALRQSEQSRETAPERALYLGLAALKQGEWAEASSHLERFTDATQRDARGWYWLAQARLFREQFDSARSAIERAISIDDQSADFFKTLGEIEVQRKDYDAAYRAWMHANKLNRSDARTAYYLGRLFFEAEFTNEAASWLREALRLKPDDYAAMTYLGLCAERMNIPETALKLYDAAITESKRQRKPFAWAFLSKAKFLRLRGEDAAALALLEEAEGTCPDSYILTTLGQVLASQGRSERAITVLRRAIALNSSLPDAHYRLALLLRSSGETEEAAAEMRRFEETRAAEQASASRMVAIRR